MFEKIYNMDIYVEGLKYDATIGINIPNDVVAICEILSIALSWRYIQIAIEQQPTII